MVNSFATGVTLDGDDDAVEVAMFSVVVVAVVGFVVVAVVTGISAVAFSRGVISGVAVFGESVFPFMCLWYRGLCVCVCLCGLLVSRDFS